MSPLKSPLCLDYGYSSGVVDVGIDEGELKD